MHIEQIQIDGFGTLCDLRLDNLANDLTALYGVNGSGKTTLLHFLSGMLCGFDDAHRRRLLPPLKSGNPGGKLTVRTSTGRYEVIRHARAGHSDTLAIRLLEGESEGVVTLRRTIEAIQKPLVAAVYAVTGYEAQALDRLVQVAQQQGIPLTATRKTLPWIGERLRKLEEEQSALLQEAPVPGTIDSLQQRRNTLQSQIEESCQAQAGRSAQLGRKLADLQSTLAVILQERAWLGQELQAVETDLSEVQTRLWSVNRRVVQEVQQIPRQTSRTPDWKRQVQALDQEISHAQQVLRDLASSRMQLSIDSAELAGADTPDAAVAFSRQRASLSAIERQTELLSGLVDHLRSGNSLSGQAGTAADSVDEIRQHIWLICQELTRQQSAEEQWLLKTQRDGVDACERELIRQIQRLRVRRDGITHAPARSTHDQAAVSRMESAAHCECEGHDSWIAAHESSGSAVQTAPQIVVRERIITNPGGRPGDPDRERQLTALRRQLREQCATAAQRQRQAESQLERIRHGLDPIAYDRNVQQLRYEFAQIEQQLADGREQWQSLALLQTILRQTQHQASQEVAAPMMQRASDFLSEMTQGRYRKFEFDPDRQELAVVNAVGAKLTPAALSRGTTEQAVLCFRMALVLELQAQGISLPLILDDVLADSDEQRLKQAAEMLVTFSKQHQVLFLTCQEHLIRILESLGATIRELPGSKRTPPPTQAVSTPPQPAAPPAFADGAHDRVQPEVPYWLQANSPLHYVPSLGEQMSRRLGALGLRSVGDLVELDPEILDMPLDSLQISAATLRRWQAEARLLCCVPNVTGRDVQVIVACGVLSPAELAECDAAELRRRIRREMSEHQSEWGLPWLRDESEWPTPAQVANWIACAHSARSWKTAVRTDSQAQAAVPSPHIQANDWAGRTPRFAPPSRAVRLHQQPSDDASPRYRFFLHLDSPIVDAPSIGPRTAERLSVIGIWQVNHLLQQSAADIARRLDRRDTPQEIVETWQQQAALMCKVPELRGHDVQVLAACGITEPDQLAAMTPGRLYAMVEPFVSSRAGQRLLRSAKTPDREEVTQWIEWARQGSLLRAA